MAVIIAHPVFTAAAYHKMIAADVFGEDDRIELVNGELVAMAPMGSRHAAVVNRIARTLSVRLDAARFLVWEQTPVALGPQDEPEPDVAVLRARADDYEDGLPSASDMLLLIEVADTSYTYDAEVKLPAYARAGVPVCWLIDLNRRRVEVHAEPSLEGYRSTRFFVHGDALPLPGGGMLNVDGVIRREP